MRRSEAILGIVAAFQAVQAMPASAQATPPPTSVIADTPPPPLTNPIPQANGTISPADIDAAWRAVETGTLAPCSTMPYHRDKPLIVIDPGHFGGADRGATSITGLYETSYIDPVAWRVGQILRKADYDVVFTREPFQPFRYDRRAVNIGWLGLNSNKTRAEFALRMAQITCHSSMEFLSIHADAALNASSRRGAAFYSAMAQNHDGRSDYGGVPLNPLSVEFGSRIIRNYRVDPAIGTELNTADFDVIAHLEERIPVLKVNAVGGLLEIGYITNSYDADILMKQADMIAAQIAQGIMLPSETQTPVPMVSIN